LDKPEPTATGWTHRTKSGRAIEVEIAVHETAFAGRNSRLAVLMDTSGRRQLEAQLRQSQKMEAVGMLAGGVAHDFNNLLTIINGYSQLILNNLKPDDPNRHSAEQIIKAGERAAGLTRQLLAFSRRQTLQPRVLELNKLVSRLVAMLRRLIGEDVELNLKLDPDVGRINADSGQMEQVIMNLVVNARDSMAKGGVVTLETANFELDQRHASKHIGLSRPYALLGDRHRFAWMRLPKRGCSSRSSPPNRPTRAPDSTSTVFGTLSRAAALWKCKAS
jgi:signal transduction histidine kinase